MATMLPNSPKQDRCGVRTASDLERKYDLGAIVGIKKAVENSIETLNKTNTVLQDFIVATLGNIQNLQNQIDGSITTWFYNGEPMLSNMPASEWETEEDKAKHVGDLYYDKDTGYSYRFIINDDTYEWYKLSDSDVTEALALANAASDTADSKRRVFTSQPVPPYDNGDLWFKNEEIYICQITKAEGETYTTKDFIIATKYTDDTAAKQVGEELKVLSGTVTTIKESADEFAVAITKTVNAMGEDIEQAQTKIEANTEEINLSVKKDNIISSINATKEKIKIMAKFIDLVGQVTAEMIDVDDLFSQNINATGSIAGATLISQTDIAKTIIEDGEIKFQYRDVRGEGDFMEVSSIYAATLGDIYATGNWTFDKIRLYNNHQNAYILATPDDYVLSGSDLNNYTTAGIYIKASSTITVLNEPSGIGTYKLIVDSLTGDENIRQTLKSTLTNITYVRTCYYRASNPVWSEWERIATSTDLDAINSNLAKKNIYNTTRETIILTQSNQVLSKSGRLYGRMTATSTSYSESSIIIWINDVPAASCYSLIGKGAVSEGFFLDVEAGDFVKISYYGTYEINNCYLYPKK